MYAPSFHFFYRHLLLKRRAASRKSTWRHLADGDRSWSTAPTDYSGLMRVSASVWATQNGRPPKHSWRGSAASSRWDDFGCVPSIIGGSRNPSSRTCSRRRAVAEIHTYGWRRKSTIRTLLLRLEGLSGLKKPDDRVSNPRNDGMNENGQTLPSTWRFSRARLSRIATVSFKSIVSNPSRMRPPRAVEKRLKSVCADFTAVDCSGRHLAIEFCFPNVHRPRSNCWVG